MATRVAHESDSEWRRHGWILVPCLAGNLLGEAKFAGEVAHGALGAVAQGKAQQVQLLAGGGEKEIALVPVGVGGAVEGAPAMPVIAQRPKQA